MNNFLRLLYQFKYLVLTFILVGIIFGLPNVLIGKFYISDSQYTPLVVTDVSFLIVDETYSVAPRIREVYDGRLFVTDPITFEYKGSPQFYLPMAENISLGLLAKLLGSVSNTYQVIDFILPPISFLLIFLFLYRISLWKTLSILGALAIIFQGLTNNIRFASKLLQYVLNGFDQQFYTLNFSPIIRPFEFNRICVPEITFIFFIGAIIYLYSAINHPERKRYAIGSGILLGILVYSYLYYWLSFLAGAMVLIFFLILKSERKQAIQIVLTLIVAGIVSIPYWISYTTFLLQPDAQEIMIRFGLEKGRYFVLPSLKTIILCIMLSGFYLVKKERTLLFLLAFPIGLFFCKNIQLITGQTVQAVHWNYRVEYIWQTIIIFSLISYLFSLERFKEKIQSIVPKMKGRLSTIMIIASIVIVLNGVFYQLILTNNTHSAFKLPTGFNEAFSWLNKNTAKDDVVMSSSFETNMLLPAYTHNNIFMPNGNLSLAPTEDIINRFIITYKLFSIPFEYIKDSLSYSEERTKLFESNFRRVSRSHPELLEKKALWYLFHRFKLPNKMREDILERYKRYNFNLKKVLERYKVDYVWVSQLERQKGNINFSKGKYKFLEQVYNYFGVTIYKIKS